MAHHQDVRQLLFSNMLALGFDPIGLERKWRMPFNKDMFALPNKKGFEVVMYFLFSRLNATMCQEQFKGCWPISDKKDEQNFRKVCRDWLQTISTEDANANLPLPRIVASLFMSPGGEKIYQLLFYFSSYILEHCIRNENGVRRHEFIQRPVMDRQNRSIVPVMANAVKASMVRTRKQFVDHSQDAVSVQHEWKVYGSELVKSYRTLTRDIRDLELQAKEEVNLAAEKSAVRGSPRGRRKSGMAQYDFDVQNVHRAHRVRKVRELWKNIDGFFKDYEKDREVIESILEGTQDAHCIDAKDLNLRIPDLLLRECEEEIQRRNVDNVYQGGKLNLLSVVHLWNLALHLYIEKLHQTGLPDFEEVTPKVTTQVHTHQAHLTNSQHLKSKLKNDIIPRLKKDIRALRDRLDSQVFRSRSPDSIRMTSLGLGFMPPTPPVNFSGEGADPSLVPGHEPIRMPPEQVSTPEAASVLMDSINQRIRAQETSKLIQGTPVFATRLATQGQPMGRNVIPSSRLPVKENVDYERVGNKQRTRHHAAPPQRSAASGEMVSATASGTTLHQTSLDVSESARQAIMAQVSKSQSKSDKFKVPAKATKQAKKNNRTAKVTPKVERHNERKSPKALDILADQIVDSVMYGTDVTNHRQVIGGCDFDLGDRSQKDGQAFISKDKLMRTPPNQSPRSQDSLGPLSSTRIETHSDVERGATDNVATKLFTDEGSDEDDGNIITLTPEPAPRPPPFSQRRKHPSGCEADGTTPNNPAAVSPQSSPVADRILDMSASMPRPTEVGGNLPKGRSLALTSGALVMTGDLLGMTESDHMSSVRKPLQRTDWGSLSDSGSESNTEQVSQTSRVAALPESTDTDSISSQGHSGIHGHIGIHIFSQDPLQNQNNSSRNVIGAESEETDQSAPENNAPHEPRTYVLSDPEDNDDVETVMDEVLPGFSPPFKEGTANENIQPESTGVDDFTELVNASARVIELQNGSFTERSETKDSKADLLTDDSPPRGGGFSRNSGARGSFRDVEQNVLQSFVSSSLQGLAQNLSADILGRRSPVRSRSPRVGDMPIKAPTGQVAADVITRYKMLKQKQAARESNTNNNASPGSTASSSLQSTPTGSRSHTPEPPTPVISEKYLQRTPTKEDGTMSKRFSLNLDDEDDDDNGNLTPLRPVYSVKKGARFNALSRSPLASPQMSSDTPPKHTQPTASTSHPTPPGVESPFRSGTIDALHEFDIEPTGRMSIDNIFNMEAPNLLSLSPGNDDPFRRARQSPKVANLLDL